ncbi:MAG TPA: regulatory protein RecX [Armatimonadota bacterium]|jgi:regulatory protein
MTRHDAQHHIAEDERAMQYALRLLGYRQRSTVELRQRLTRKDFSTRIIEQTVATLTRLRLLDDQEFAQAWVTSRPGRGPARLRQELLTKGIARTDAENAIQTGITAEDEFRSAWQVAQRALHGPTAPPERTELLRVRRLLQRRGFSFDVIGRVCAGLNDRLTVEGDWLELP